MIILLIIVILFTIAHLMAKYKPFIKDKAGYNTYYHIKKKIWIFPEYTGICFEKIDVAIIFLRIQTGKDGYDKCITICNISFIWGN